MYKQVSQWDPHDGTLAGLHADKSIGQHNWLSRQCKSYQKIKSKEKNLFKKMDTGKKTTVKLSRKIYLRGIYTENISED